MAAMVVVAVAVAAAAGDGEGARAVRLAGAVRCCRRGADRQGQRRYDERGRRGRAAGGGGHGAADRAGKSVEIG